MINGNPKRILLKIKHGLGDAMTASIVVRHVKHYWPEAEVAVEATVDRHAVYPMASTLYSLPRFDVHAEYNVVYLHLQRPDQSYPDCPSTKATRCLLEEIGCKPIPELYYYEVEPTEQDVTKVDQYLTEELQGKPYAVIHGTGTSMPSRKNLTDWEVAALICKVEDQGLYPVVLDWIDVWAGRSPGRGHWLWDGGKMGTAGVIYELIRRAAVFHGIDSGPAHLAAATQTESHVYWWETHPLHCFDPCGNVVHHVPNFHIELIQEPTTTGAKYFHEHYRWKFYDADLTKHIEDISFEDE